MRSWYNPQTRRNSLWPVASVAIALLLTVNMPVAFAGTKPENGRTYSGRVTPFKAAAPTSASEESVVGMNEWLNKERVIFLSGEITPELAEIVISQLLYLDHQAPGKDIYVYINSLGGDIASGLAIFDVMRSLQSDVVTVGLGEASSMGSFLLAGGTKGKRIALPNTRIMIHQPWDDNPGMQASDIAITAKEILYLKNLLNRLLSQFTGQPLKRIETDSDRDFFMSAEEAKAYGIIDKTSTHLPSATRPLKH